MSAIWPFFNQSFSNANINKILNEIDQDNAKRIAQNALPKQNASPSVTNGLSVSKPSIVTTSTPTTSTTSVMPISSPSTSLLTSNPINVSQSQNNSPIDNSISTTASLSPHVAYSPTTTQFNITASQLLHSIQNNSPSPSPSPLAKMTNANTLSISPSAFLNDPVSLNSNEPNDKDDSDDKAELGDSSEPDDKGEPSVQGELNDRDVPPNIPTTLPRRPSSVQFPKSNINVHLFNELLDQANILDEINLSKNQKLINYLSQKDVINTMFEYILFSMTLSKYTRISEVPSEYLKHDIFVSSSSSDDLIRSLNNSTDNFLENNLTNNDNENNDAGNNENDDNTNNNTTDESIDKLQIALQRASMISEIMILPTSNIHQTLLTNFDMFTKLWSGFMNNDPKFYFKNTHLIESPNNDADDSANELGDTGDESDEDEDGEEEEEEDDDDGDEEEEGDEDNGNDDDTRSVFSQPIEVSITDAQKLSELEESNDYSLLRDSHEIILFNNFLKFVDDLALLNISGFMNFIRFEQKNNKLTDQFIKFIPYSQTICDLLVRLISTDKPYNSNGLINILLDQNLILNLLRLCKTYYLDHQVQDNVCNLLNGIVGISSNIGFWDDNNNNNNNNGNGNQEDSQQDPASTNPNIGPNDLTRQLVSQECIEEMLDIILTYGNYGLVTIVSVIIEVIRKNNSDYDEFDWIASVSYINEENKILPNSRDPIYLGNLLKLFSTNLDKIVETYLTDEYYEFKQIEKLNSSIGHEIEPLGYERFKIMELIAELLHCSNMILMNKSIELDKLIHKRDSLRGVKKTEQLMNDAINGLIINDSNTNASSNNNTLPGDNELSNNNASLNDNELNNDAPDNSDTNNNNTNTTEANHNDLSIDDDLLVLSTSIPYIESALNLSIGNFFKYKLLENNAIPLISLKLTKFPWNNFMHNVIFDLIQQIFNGRLANWDEDRAINQEETIFDDNLSLNKILIWSLFGSYEDFDSGDDSHYKDYKCLDDKYPGYFNLPLFIVHCYKLSNGMYKTSNFRFGYMGHLTLIAEEIHKFQSYVENFGATKNENAFGLHKEVEDNIRPFYLKSSYFIFNELYESIFENKGNFDCWLEFVNNELREISSMYNKVLGNPNEIEPETEPELEQDQAGLTHSQVLEMMDIQETPKAEGAIILDNGDSKEFRQGGNANGGNDEDDNEDEDDEDEDYDYEGNRDNVANKNEIDVTH